jgi:hypothetical protein
MTILSPQRRKERKVNPGDKKKDRVVRCLDSHDSRQMRVAHIAGFPRIFFSAFLCVPLKGVLKRILGVFAVKGFTRST